VAVFLKNRLVLTPQSFDKAGLLFNKESLPQKNFEMTIDFEISNTKQSSLSHGSMQIYFLRGNPQRSAHEFAKGFNQEFTGLMIEIKENNSRMPTAQSV
jgi:Legume-like lectin family